MLAGTRKCIPQVTRKSHASDSQMSASTATGAKSRKWLAGVSQLCRRCMATVSQVSRSSLAGGQACTQLGCALLCFLNLIPFEKWSRAYHSISLAWNFLGWFLSLPAIILRMVFMCLSQLQHKIVKVNSGFQRDFSNTCTYKYFVPDKTEEIQGLSVHSRGDIVPLGDGDSELPPGVGMSSIIRRMGKLYGAVWWMRRVVSYHLSTRWKSKLPSENNPLFCDPCDSSIIKEVLSGTRDHSPLKRQVNISESNVVWLISSQNHEYTYLASKPLEQRLR